MSGYDEMRALISVHDDFSEAIEHIVMLIEHGFVPMGDATSKLHGILAESLQLYDGRNAECVAFAADPDFERYLQRVANGYNARHPYRKVSARRLSRPMHRRAFLAWKQDRCLLEQAPV